MLALLHDRNLPQHLPLRALQPIHQMRSASAHPLQAPALCTRTGRSGGSRTLHGVLRAELLHAVLALAAAGLDGDDHVPAVDVEALVDVAVLAAPEAVAEQVLVEHAVRGRVARGADLLGHDDRGGEVVDRAWGAVARCVGIGAVVGGRLGGEVDDV